MIFLWAGVFFAIGLIIALLGYREARKPRWRVLYTCVADGCHHRLTWDEVCHSRGVCPYCGYTSNGTVLAATKTSEWR